MALCSRSAAFSVVYVQQLGAHASCGFGVYEPHSSLRFRVPLGIGTIGRAACHLYAAAQSTFQTDLSPTLSIDNAWAVGFRFGEALHPGPVGLLAFPSPIPPSAPRTSPPASRVLPRDSRGCPPDQRRIDVFFGSNSASMQPGAQELAEPRLPVVGSPDTSAFRLAIVNPTSLLHKESQLMDLASHVYVLSETSAVAAAQDIAENRFRKAGLSVTWGSPVPSHWRENAAGPSLRGYAAGVAIASLFQFDDLLQSWEVQGMMPIDFWCPTSALARCMLVSSLFMAGLLTIPVRLQRIPGFFRRWPALLRSPRSPRLLPETLTLMSRSSRAGPPFSARAMPSCLICPAAVSGSSCPPHAEVAHGMTLPCSLQCFSKCSVELRLTPNATCLTRIPQFC